MALREDIKSARSQSLWDLGDKEEEDYPGEEDGEEVEMES